MIIGLLLALVAGVFLSLQNIFNSKVNEHAGSQATTTLVLGMGFLASLIIGIFSEGKNIFLLENMKTWYWFSGILGVAVVTCIVTSIRLLGPTYAISIALTSQLLFALLFDTNGWMGIKKVPFTMNQLIGVLVIVGGILVFKLSGKSEKEDKATKVPQSSREDQTLSV